MRPKVFVGSSGEAIDVCRAIQGELDDDFDVTVWDQDIFRLSYGVVSEKRAADLANNTVRDLILQVIPV